MDINEFSFLKERVQLKEKSLEAEELSPKEKKELLKEAIDEKIEPVLNQYPSEINVKNIPTTIISSSPNDKDKVVNELIDIALNHDITLAIERALKTGNAYIIDTFRDKLADVYYEKLKEEGII